MRLLLASALVVAYVVLEAAAECTKRPNIIMVLVDDLGYTDVNFDNTREPNFVTPTIDKLNREGIRMLSTYTPPNCSPSRHCLLSGTYPYRYGNQDNGISVQTVGHPPLNLTNLPQKLRQLKYRTHMIGKWHLGFCAREQTPINRGYSSWLGFYLGEGDHFTHFGKKGAYDLRFAERPDDLSDDVVLDETVIPPDQSEGRYSTELFGSRAVQIIKEHAQKYGTDGCTPFYIQLCTAAIHGPNQVPKRYISDTLCKNIPDIPDYYNNKVKEHNGRRVKCGMVLAVDEAIRNITTMLEQTGQLDNTLIAFSSDNGGSWTQGSSNFPLRGGKTTLWEGGIRVPSFIWSANSDILPYRNWDWNGLHYQTDWYPTFYGFATKNGANVPEALDGINHYDTLINKLPTSQRTEFAYVNEIQEEHGTLRQGDFKLLVNQTRYGGWYSPPKHSWDDYPWTDLPEGISAEEPTVSERIQLFNIANDPSETVNLINLPQPQRPERMVRPNLDEYNLDPKPVQPGKSNTDYEAKLKQYNIDLATWKERKAGYDAAMKKFTQLKAEYDASIDQWESDLRANKARAGKMMDRLYNYYWGKLWVPTNRDLKLSTPDKLNYVVPNYSPTTYVWSPGWCDNDVPDNPPGVGGEDDD